MWEGVNEADDGMVGGTAWRGGEIGVGGGTTATNYRQVRGARPSYHFPVAIPAAEPSPPTISSCRIALHPHALTTVAPTHAHAPQNLQRR